MTTTAEAGIKRALSLAKASRYAEAESIMEDIEVEGLPVDLVRKAALVYSYCHKDEACEKCWLWVVDNIDVRSGDWYMLGSIQLALSKDEQAIDNFLREIEEYKRTKDQAYLVCTGITLSSVLVKKARIKEAREVLKLLKTDDAYYVRGEGNITKARLEELIHAQ
jgi:hypothetical protein